MKLEYKDSNHSYRAVVDGVVKTPVSVTKIKGETLEKNGLAKWPMMQALKYLFGYYSFVKDGNTIAGVNTTAALWDSGISLNDSSFTDRKYIQEYCDIACQESTKRSGEGMATGTEVHSWVDNFINDKPQTVILSGDAENAFYSFQKWWKEVNPTVIKSEEILYSLEYNVSGTLDYILDIPGKGVVLCDLKTTKTSEVAPRGVYYDNFIQLGMYALMVNEMNLVPYDISDLMVISARKDGGFDTVTASELGLSVYACMKWAIHVIECYSLMVHTKNELTPPVVKVRKVRRSGKLN